MVFETVLRSDIHRPVDVVQLTGNLFSGDNGGNKITVEIYDGDEHAEIAAGSSVTGYIIRPDKKTVVVEGALTEGYKASIELPQSAYAVVGQIGIVIKVGDSSDVTTVGACTAYVYKSTTDTYVDPGTVIPDISTLMGYISACTAATASAEAATTAANEAAEEAVEIAEEAVADLAEIVAPTFDPAEPNDPKTYVTDSGKLYYLPEGHTAGTTFANTTKRECTVGEELYSKDQQYGIQDDRTNELYGLVNYGYDTLQTFEASSTYYPFTVVRNKNVFTLNGTSNGTRRVKICNTMARSMNETQTKAFTGGIYLIPGHRYRITEERLSGSSTLNNVFAMPSVSMYKIGSSGTVGAGSDNKGDIYIREFVAEDSEYIPCLYFVNGYEMTNLVISITIKDLDVESASDCPTTKAPAIENTIESSNGVVHFTDAAADMPMSLTVETGYEQNFNGYEYPWMGGEGKNLFPGFGTASSSSSWYSYNIPVDLNTNEFYYISGLDGTHKMMVRAYDANYTFLGRTTGAVRTVLKFSKASITTDVPSGADLDTITYVKVNIYDWSGVTQDELNAIPIQMEIGEEATDYVPYENICPITGHDHVDITVSDNENGNINVLDSSLIEYGSYSTTGSPSSNDDPAYRRFSVTLQAGTYIVETNIENPYLVRYLVDNNQVGSSSTVAQYVFTISQESNVKMVYRNTETTQLPDTTEITIKKDYRTYNIAFPNALGTVYGGQITINNDGTGTFVQTWYRHIFDGTESIYAVSSEANRFMRYDLPSTYPKPFSTAHAVRNSETKSSHSRIYTITASTTGNGQGIYYNSSYLYYGIRTNKIVNKNQTADELKAYFAEQYANGTPDTIIYRCVPTEPVRLTLQQVRTLLGVGSISCDTGNILEVNYPADTKNYIDDTKDTVDGIISTIETPVAKENHAVGDVFICGDKLYRATDAIATGETIAEGTNVASTITIGSDQVPLTLTNYIKSILLNVNSIGADVSYLNTKVIDPDEAMSKNMYIQNGTLTYSGRTVTVKDGVINFSCPSTSGANYRSIWITGTALAGGSENLNNSVPPVGNAVPVSNLTTANAVRVHYDKISGTGYCYIAIAYCTVDGTTVTLVGSKQSFTSNNETDYTVNLNIPANATHYAIQVYQTTAAACEYNAYVKFMKLPETT